MEEAVKHLVWLVWGIAFGPQSTLSVWASGLTLAVACLFIVRAQRRRRRRLRLKTWRRILLPRRIWASKTGWSDIGWFTFNQLGFTIAFGWAFFSAEWLSARLVAAFDGASLMHAPRPVALLLASGAMFLAYEFSYWLGHLLKHKIPAFWAFHRMHHVPSELTPLTGFRVHPLDTIIFYWILSPVMGVTGGVLPLLLGPEAMPVAMGGLNLFFYASTVLIVHIQHSHFWVTYGPVWGRILLGPAHHQLHHSADPAHYDSNFGNSIALFDRLYGSFVMPAERRGGMAFGLDADDPNRHGFVATALMPFVHAWRSLRPARAKSATA